MNTRGFIIEISILWVEVESILQPRGKGIGGR